MGNHLFLNRTELFNVHIVLVAKRTNGVVVRQNKWVMGVAHAITQDYVPYVKEQVLSYIMNE